MFLTFPLLSAVSSFLLDLQERPIITQIFATDTFAFGMEVIAMAGTASDWNWLRLYRQAVLEPDPRQLRVRIAKAQRAIWRRARELWYAGVRDTPERRQMDAASDLLGILCTLAARK